MIKTLRGLYRTFDLLYKGIEDVCQQCKDDDCKGYIWLLPQEAEELCKEGVEILEINGNTYFIHPFTGKNGVIDIEQIKPPCPLCKDKRCTVYKKRPLVCRMYPLSLATENGIIYLVLHLDCLYSRQRVADVLFQKQAVTIFKHIHPQLFEEILKTHRLVNYLSKFPHGTNKYLRIATVEQLQGKKEEVKHV